MNPQCFTNAQSSSVAAGAWLSLAGLLPNTRGAMIASDPSNETDLLVLVLPVNSSAPIEDPSAAFKGVWVVKPGEAIYGQGLCGGRLVVISAVSGNALYQIYPMGDAPPGIIRSGGDPVVPYGRNLVAAPASWLTGTPWTAASNPPLPSSIKSFLVQYSAGFACHLEFDAGSLTDQSFTGITTGRTPFFPGVPVTTIYPPAAGQYITGLIVEF